MNGQQLETYLISIPVVLLVLLFIIRIYLYWQFSVGQWIFANPNTSISSKDKLKFFLQSFSYWLYPIRTEGKTEDLERKRNLANGALFGMVLLLAVLIVIAAFIRKSEFILV